MNLTPLGIKRQCITDIRAFDFHIILKKRKERLYMQQVAYTDWEA